ncbi:hypothetical protein [Bradyrhizobium sp. CCGB01]|uniref:hypothetical protein n=1 Tax=Bradyrhizobium sp. CCGB01 TaxID=2949634 RepID=UPI0020B1EDF6|nr:hypothetical protein [Bradyrhizobium sp. CCGB01]MCP3405550.1 hypothetical protein [Bradyrhizobium sp. CCGB01]
MTKQSNFNDEFGISTSAFHDFAKRSIGTQTEFSKKLLDIYCHWQERVQTESTQAMEVFGKISSTSSSTDQIGLLQVWMKDATQRAAQDVIYSREATKGLLPLFGSAELFRPAVLFPPLGTLNLPAGAGINFHYGSWQLPTLRIEGGAGTMNSWLPHQEAHMTAFS